MNAAVKEWHEEHLRFGRLLDLLDMEVAAFHAGGEPDYSLMRDIVYYLRQFGDRVHHPREDAAFSLLAARDAGMKALLDRLQQEHRVIGTAGDELLSRLDEVAAEVVIERSKLEAVAATYLVFYRHHLATEEVEILPRAALLLTHEDWARVADAAPGGDDPLFGSGFETRYEQLRRQVIADSDNR